MIKTVIHIGANKTASTTLQRTLFCKHSGIHYVGEDADNYPEYCGLVNSMVSDDDMYYSADQCKELFEYELSRAAGKTFIYSNEDVMTSKIPALCAKRIKERLPDADVLLVIRNQLTAVPSFYASHGAFLKPAPPEYFRRYVSFEDWMKFQIMFIKYGALASFYYKKQLSIYEELFGKERIKILLFEEFIQDKTSFIRKLSNALQIDFNEAYKLIEGRHERKRVSRRNLNYTRFRTSFFWNVAFTRYIPGGKKLASMLQQYLDSGPPAKIKLSDEWRDSIQKLYAEDNSKLVSDYNLPIEEYGYPLI